MQKSWIENQAKMDMALTKTDMPDVHDEIEPSTVQATVIDFDITERSPNTATVVVYLSVPDGNGDTSMYSISQTIDYDSESQLRSVFEENSGAVTNPVGQTVEVSRTQDGWTLFGIDLSERKTQPNNSQKIRRQMTEMYRKTLCEETKSKMKYGELEDFYVLHSEPNIQQDYTVGLFVSMPTGEMKTLEVIHDQHNPSKLLDSIVDTTDSLRSQIGFEIPLWYDADEDEWYIITKEFSWFSKKLKSIGVTPPSDKYLESFGRKYDVYKPRQIPSNPEEVPEDRIPSISDLSQIP